MDLNYDLEVSKEDEQFLRNHWKLISTCQFLNLFKNVLKLSVPVTPYDLEQSLLRPQHDPLCAELMSRLLQKKNFKKDAGGQSSAQLQTSESNNAFNSLEYDAWNMLLAKRFSMMFKNYRKFAVKFLGQDPMVAPLNQAELPSASQQAEMELIERPQDVITDSQLMDLNKEEVKAPDAVIPEEEAKHSIEAQSQIDTTNNQQKSQTAIIEESKERITRGRLRRAANENGDSQNAKVQTKKGKEPPQTPIKQQEVEIPQEPEIKLPEQQWSSEVRDHLLTFNEKLATVKFAHYASLQWKTEFLQIMKLFNEELQGVDPFYIEGQDWNQQNQKEDQTSNFYSNFIDADAIDDFEDFNALQGFGQKQIEVQFNRFHEIPTSNRLDILYFLCQNKLDSEQPDFMQEVQALSQQKAVRLESIDGQPIKMSDEIKQMLEPVNLGLLKPLGTLNEDVFEIKAGQYFYFPFFSDTRIYRQSLDNHTFELILEDFDQIQLFLETLKVQDGREDCQEIQEKLAKYSDSLKKFSEEMKWKEASKVRKLKSQIRSRKIQELSKKKLQFESRSNQIQTDMLHHAQKQVMTRKQVDVIKQKITKSSSGSHQEEKKKESRSSRYAEIQREKQERERQDRQRRLEKRMRLKEGGGRRSGRLVGGRRGRGGESEDYYDEEDDNGGQDEQHYQSEVQGDGYETNKRRKTDTREQVEEAPQEEYEIVLSGHLLMIYQRDEMDPTKISNFNMVIKGKWRLTVEDQSEDFIYKKIDVPVQEELLTELFCEKASDRIKLPNSEAMNTFIVQNHQSLLEKFFACQGFYNGYFKYNDEEVTEKFSFILRKPRNSRKMNVYDMCGYGENDIGAFTMEGQMNLLPTEKLQEKDGVKGFKKIKLGKFSIKKIYHKTKVLEDLVEEVQNERQEAQQQQSIMIEIKPRQNLQYSGHQSIGSQDQMQSQGSEMSQQSIPRFSKISTYQQQPPLQVQIPSIPRSIQIPNQGIIASNLSLQSRPQIQMLTSQQPFPSLPLMASHLTQQHQIVQPPTIKPDLNHLLINQLPQIVDPSKTFPLQGIFQQLQQQHDQTLMNQAHGLGQTLMRDPIPSILNPFSQLQTASAQDPSAIIQDLMKQINETQQKLNSNPNGGLWNPNQQ